jgi:hypothetical protein
MSGQSKIKTAGAGIMLVGAGLGFARSGWAGMKGPRAPSAAQAAPPAAAASAGKRLLFAAIALFGAFAFICGVLLLLSLLISE